MGRRWAALAGMVALAASLVVSAPAPDALATWSAASTTRVEAVDNVETAIRFTRMAFPSDGPGEALLGRDDLFSDTLAAGSATGRPVLLTDRDELDRRTADELDRLDVTEVTILGGVEAIAPEVEEQLEELGYAVARIGGATRIETAVGIASHYHPRADAPVVLARAAGEGTAAFADTLGGSALAHTLGGALVLTPSDRLHPAVERFLQEAGVTDVVIAGGVHAISAAVEGHVAALGIDVDRAQGASRSGTALAQAARRGLPSAADADAVLLIDGYHDLAWAAGFSAATWAAVNRVAIVLADGTGLSRATSDYLIDTPGVPLVCAPRVSAAACDQATQTLRMPPFATTGAVTLRQPSSSVELIGFHESNHDGAQQLDPLDSGPTMVTMESRGRGTGARTSADVVAQPGVAVRAPVTGTVIRAGSYVLYCDHTDHYAVIEPDDHPGWEVKMLHMVGLRVQRGDRVQAARTVIADGPRQLPFDSQVDDHSSDRDWPHVHLEVVDPSVPDRPGRGC
ncbi:MAG: cell wall-binding repeat-containing protein [Actinobacteria bacterium]|nr:cell wall-binding repeat-containing protein [Actinomycetota bacterium]